jgi:iron complex outermembrane receptor protein
MTFTQHTPIANISPHQLNYRLYSGFAQDEIALSGQHLFLTLGIKVGHNIYTGGEFEPAARLLFRRSEHETYWAAVSRATRIPSQLEEGFRLAAPIRLTPPLELLISGNPHFQSEVLLGYEAGYRRLITQNFYFDVAGFFNNYDRLQGFLPTVLETDPVVNEPALTTLYGNTVQGSTRGIEFAPEWKIASWWQWKGAYSLLRYDLKSRPGFSDPNTITGYVGSTPLNQIAVESRVDLPKHLEFDQALRHEGSLPAQQVPSYTTADLRLGWHYKNFDLSANGRDMIDQGHTEFGAGDGTVATLGIRRSIFAKLVWTAKP